LVLVEPVSSAIALPNSKGIQHRAENLHAGKVKAIPAANGVTGGDHARPQAKHDPVTHRAEKGGVGDGEYGRRVKKDEIELV